MIYWPVQGAPRLIRVAAFVSGKLLVIMERACFAHEVPATVKYLREARYVCAPGMRLWIEDVHQPATVATLERWF